MPPPVVVVGGIVTCNGVVAAGRVEADAPVVVAGSTARNGVVV